MDPRLEEPPCAVRGKSRWPMLAASTRALLPDHAAPRAPSRRSDPPTPRRGRPRLGRKRSGEGGIRTHGDHKATPVFETGPFNRSGTSPVGLAGPFLPAV